MSKEKIGKVNANSATSTWIAIGKWFDALEQFGRCPSYKRSHAFHSRLKKMIKNSTPSKSQHIFLILSPSSCCFILHYHQSLTFQVFRGVFPPWKRRKRTPKKFLPRMTMAKVSIIKLCSTHKYLGIPTKPWIGAGSLGTGSGDLAITRSFCT